MFHLPGRGTTALTVKSSPPKTAQTATRLGVRAGVLTKRDERGAWQRRYCALVPQTLLFYYDDETSDDARGIIDLEYYGDVQIVRGRTLRLATASDVPLRSFFFQAETEVSDSAPKMNLNLIWWRRWRLHDHMRVHASRESFATVSINTGTGPEVVRGLVTGAVLCGRR